jgi:hypothetical protein
MPIREGCKADSGIALSDRSTKSLSMLLPPFSISELLSLLEINEREGYIYYYNSIGEGENADMKVRIESPIWR